MKNRTLRAATALFAAIGVLSCSKEPAPAPAPGMPATPDAPAGRYVSFVAGTPEAETVSASAAPATAALPVTRAGYDGATGHAVWEAGDCVSIFVDGDTQNKNLRFTQKAGTLAADRRTVVYEGAFATSVSGTQTVYAVYPYDSQMSLFGTAVNMTFPGRQVYTPDGYTAIPLFGKYEGDIAGLHFKGFVNPFAVVELRLSSADPVRVTRIVFQGNDDEPVSGPIRVDMSGSYPAITFEYDASKSIVLDCGDGVPLSTAPTSFHIAIPVQAYAKGYRFDIRTDREGAGGIVLKAKSGGVTPSANTIYGTPERSLTAAQYETVIPDAAFRTWLSANGWVTVDDPATGRVTIVDTTTREMDCSFQQISSLEGIEYFPQLTALNCSFNYLAALDVSALTSLTSLSCISNRLSELDVSALTSLTSLNCSGNRLSELDVSVLTSLTLLNCSNNRLTAMDVTANRQLTELLCYGNLLTTLDVKANTLLTRLLCNNNDLTALDVAANTKLTGLRCEENDLTTLDVKTNTQLNDLYCNGNRLEELDVTANTLLTELKCQTNRLTAINISNNPLLTLFACGKNHIATLDATSITDPEAAIYCGKQTAPDGAAITLQLTLREALRARWEGQLQSMSDNASVEATFVP